MEENTAYPSGPMATGFTGDSEKAMPPVPEWAVPARRDDAVGRLAWQLLEGGPGGSPDFSAAGRLFDALMDEGDRESAFKFRRSVMAVVNALGPVAARGRLRALQMWLREVQERSRESTSHLLYDFDSVCAALAKAAELASVPAASVVEEGAARTVVRADVGYSHVGQRVTLPDGRRGLVIEDADTEGMSRIVLGD